MQTLTHGASRANPASTLPRFSRKWLGAVAATLMLAAFSTGALAHGYKVGDIEVHHPWSKSVPEGAKVAAGYVKLTNHGAEADRLISATAEVADKVEIHEMAVDASGVMTMRELAGGVEIPAGATVELKPGGVHIMLMGMKQWTKEGDKFKGTLTFEKAGSVDVEFAVQGAGKDAAASPDGSKPDDPHAGHGG